MAYQVIVNPFTGELQLVNNSSGGGTGNVVGESPTDINAIARWDNITGTLIKNSAGTYIQDSGSIQAQDFMQNRQVTGNINVPTNYTMITDAIEMQPGGYIAMNPGSKIVII